MYSQLVCWHTFTKHKKIQVGRQLLLFFFVSKCEKLCRLFGACSSSSLRSLLLYFLIQQWFYFMINFSNYENFPHNFMAGVHLRLGPSKCFCVLQRYSICCGCLSQRAEKRGKLGWRAWLPVDPALARCRPLSEGHQTEFSCRAHISVFFKGSQTGGTLRF